MLLFGLFRKKKTHVSPVPQPKPETKVEPDVQKESQAQQVEPQEPKKQRKLSYHITKHPQGGWQIKRGKADRAFKRFDTQKEAIEFAKQMEQERGISFIIHKTDGTTRKKTY